ncbi:alpha/beta fold hydrolase [Nocardia sp. alder85J]|uniref:alpha/beta fold hydrolase n=1 Tax=Nocardia sp. alder85J TaxID=2862949 RepID=UPI001CD38CF7|nr:alpha/beta hydrolase [Nocardia sp. alder85J]MCX4090910.1 alpha/beta hydrolase [Nocardia sp. alder85J]
MTTARTARIDDIEIWTDRHGAPTDPAILLLAGDTASATAWPQPLTDRFTAAGYQVIRLDYRDTGRSTRREFAGHPYTFDDLATDATAVLDTWDIDAAHVVGFGMGGGTAQLLALDHPQRLRTVTLSNCFALGIDFFGNWQRALTGEPTLDGLPTPDPDFTRLATSPAPPADAIQRALAGDFYDESELRAAARRAETHAGQPDTRKVHPHSQLRAGFDGRGEHLPAITTPALVIQGMRDPINPPPHGRHLAGLIPGARLVEIPGMGHSLPAAVHDTYATAILEHLRRNTQHSHTDSEPAQETA